MRKLRQFTVEGFGEFPFDMLRYDACYPLSEADARRLAYDYHTRRRVTLQTSAPGVRPTKERWNSFGWVVLP